MAALDKRNWLLANNNVGDLHEKTRDIGCWQWSTEGDKIKKMVVRQIILWVIC